MNDQNPVAEPTPVDPSVNEFDPPADTLGSQIARTDAALAAWRDESVRRRAEYDQQVAEERAAATARRARLLQSAGLFAGTAAVTGAVTFAVGWWLLAPPAATPQTTVIPVVAALDAPVVVAPPPAPAVVEAVLAEPPVVRGLAVAEGSAKVWSDRKHVWIAFRALETGPIRLHWKDAAGVEVLESMRCVTSDCRAGRSHGRIAAALGAGAAPGTWTIEACGASGCATVGTFAAGS